MKLYRHGDVLLIERAAPAEAIEQQRGSEITIALGEATGHHHTLYGAVPDAIVLRGFESRRYLEIVEPVSLRHQEHKALQIDPGQYEIVIEREYDYCENDMKKVVD